MQNTNDYQKLAKALFGSEFNDADLLITAFTHRSYLNEHRKSVKEHNERLEFLGDAVLELVVTEYLYQNHKDPEGVLTNWRSALVRTESISLAAKNNGLEEFLRLSRGEKRGSERAREQILANTYEAVVGALYLDKDYQAARDFITKTLLVTFTQILKSGSWMDPKSRLQELAQARGNATPSYRVIEAEGPDHDKTFKVGVYVDGQLKANGVGPSKQAAQVAAAVKALEEYL